MSLSDKGAHRRPVEGRGSEIQRPVSRMRWSSNVNKHGALRFYRGRRGGLCTFPTWQRGGPVGKLELGKVYPFTIMFLNLKTAE